MLEILKNKKNYVNFFSFSLNNWATSVVFVFPFLDAAVPKQLSFQMEATPNMLGIVAFHNDLSFVLAIVSGFTLVILLRMIFLFSVANVSVDDKSQVVLLKTGIRPFQHHTALEVVWTSIPIIILLLIAGPSLSLLYSSDELIDPRITIKVIGHQWYWTYEMSDAVRFNPVPSNPSVFFDILGDDRLSSPVDDTKELFAAAAYTHLFSVYENTYNYCVNNFFNEQLEIIKIYFSLHQNLTDEHLEQIATAVCADTESQHFFSHFRALQEYYFSPEFTESSIQRYLSAVVEHITKSDTDTAANVSVELPAFQNFLCNDDIAYANDLEYISVLVYSNWDPESPVDLTEEQIAAWVYTDFVASQHFSNLNVWAQWGEHPVFVEALVGIYVHYQEVQNLLDSLQFYWLLKIAPEVCNALFDESIKTTEGFFDFAVFFYYSAAEQFSDAETFFNQTQQDGGCRSVSSILEVESSVLNDYYTWCSLLHTGDVGVASSAVWSWGETADLCGLDYVFDSYMVPDTDLELGQLRLLETTKSLVVPTDTQIRLLVTSSDVLHSWAVPSLGIKIDACPGRLNQVGTGIFRRGIFYGQCSEICGINHGFMPIQLEAIGMPSFRQYFAENYVVTGVRAQ